MIDINYIYIKNYKCFKSGKYIGFDTIKPINLIIGRNNTGKSSLLDIFSFCTDLNQFKSNRKYFDEIVLGKSISDTEISSVFSRSSAGGVIGVNHYAFGQRFINKVFPVKVSINSEYSRDSFLGQYSESFNTNEFDPKYKQYWSELARRISNPLSQNSFFRISAERDIRPELDNHELTLESNGVGATNIIHKFVNHSSLDSKLVEKTLLDGLNLIMYPDAVFTDIVVQQIETESKDLSWEIFLEEASKGRIALSKSGSGLKTIILVLINLILMPVVHKKSPSDIIFGFEELENNLHPALQRKLFSFIQNWVMQNNSTIFITTHSNVPINLCNGNPNAQVIHVIGDSNNSEPKRVINYLDEVQILDDLDVRASDILQSNGIIWVEGPSDRIYLNKWIDLFSNNTLKEGLHYQVLFYGGRLLAHIGFEEFNYSDSNTQDKLINLLLTNRNAAIIIDSDKRYQGDKINETKKRIRTEFKKVSAFCWITKGKEIENYIPQNIIERYVGINAKKNFEKYQTIDDFLDELKDGLGKQFLRNKVKFAISIKEQLIISDLENTYDFKENVLKLIEVIKKWNYLEENN